MVVVVGRENTRRGVSVAVGAPESGKIWKIEGRRKEAGQPCGPRGAGRPLSCGVWWTQHAPRLLRLLTLR